MQLSRLRWEKVKLTFYSYGGSLLTYTFCGFSCVQYEDCVKDCDQAVEKGRSLHADYKLIAKALTRKGTTFVKMAKTSKDYEPAIEAFNKALTEHRNPDTLKKLNDAERTKKELEQQECFDPAAADIEREKGNKFFLLLCMHATLLLLCRPTLSVSIVKIAIC